AGGVVIRKRDGAWWMAAIEPPTEPPSAAAEFEADRPKADRPKTDRPRHSVARRKKVLALPKGLVDPGEKPLETALREVYEETGVTATPICKLADIKYVYVRTWAGGERVFKIVSFYLLNYESGQIDDIAHAQRTEVARERWVPLEDAPKLLAYKGEKEVARRALEYVKAHAALEVST